jgi:hypothetical protein
MISDVHDRTGGNLLHMVCDDQHAGHLRAEPSSHSSAHRASRLAQSDDMNGPIQRQRFERPPSGRGRLDCLEGSGEGLPDHPLGAGNGHDHWIHPHIFVWPSASHDRDSAQTPASKPGSPLGYTPDPGFGPRIIRLIRSRFVGSMFDVAVNRLASTSASTALRFQ